MSSPLNQKYDDLDVKYNEQSNTHGMPPLFGKTNKTPIDSPYRINDLINKFSEAAKHLNSQEKFNDQMKTFDEDFIHNYKVEENQKQITTPSKNTTKNIQITKENIPSENYWGPSSPTRIIPLGSFGPKTYACNNLGTKFQQVKSPNIDHFVKDVKKVENPNNMKLRHDNDDWLTPAPLPTRIPILKTKMNPQTSLGPIATPIIKPTAPPGFPTNQPIPGIAEHTVPLRPQYVNTNNASNVPFPSEFKINQMQQSQQSPSHNVPQETLIWQDWKDSQNPAVYKNQQGGTISNNLQYKPYGSGAYYTELTLPKYMNPNQEDPFETYWNYGKQQPVYPQQQPRAIEKKLLGTSFPELEKDLRSNEMNARQYESKNYSNNILSTTMNQKDKNVKIKEEENKVYHVHSPYKFPGAQPYENTKKVDEIKTISKNNFITYNDYSLENTFKPMQEESLNKDTYKIIEQSNNNQSEDWLNEIKKYRLLKKEELDNNILKLNQSGVSNKNINYKIFESNQLEVNTKNTNVIFN